MRIFLAWTALLTFGVVCLALVAGRVAPLAVANDGELEPEKSDNQLAEGDGKIRKGDASKRKAGLWNEGKAVFSDVEIIDDFGLLKYARGYKPEQPINFSHVLHVQENNMECTYCHSGVSKSPYATIPAVETCMGCHSNVATDSPEIKKLKEFYDKGEPVPWEPVHHLPEHVYFTHERHIKAGIGCQNCHGQVQEMDQVEKVSSLKMGFCISCHRENGASIDCLVCHQ